MNNVQRILTAFVILLGVVVGCLSNSEISEKQNPSILKESRSPHDRDGGEHGHKGSSEHDRKGEGSHGGEGEEPGVEYNLNETYNHVRNGVRLILAYEPQKQFLFRHGEKHNRKNFETGSC